MITKLLLTSAICLSGLALSAQEFCGLPKASTELHAKHPVIIQNAHAIQQAPPGNSLQKTANATYIIPVVFHIVHQYGPENISDLQVQDAVRILNENFQMRNPDTSQIVPAFKSIKGSMDIEFRLAKLDPNGNCTNGIVRVVSGMTYNAGDNVKTDQWPPSKYLNIWVVKSLAQTGLAGYAYMPPQAASMPSVDGLIILSSYVGSIGTGSPSTSKVMTHELGHYFNLQHTWGPGSSGTCGDDGISDTPVTTGNSSCSNMNPSVCNPPIIENIQNYMDVSYCSCMFTQGQCQWVANTLNSTVASRNNLWTAANLLATGTDNAGFTSTATCKPTADLNANYKNVCEGTSITFMDVSYNGPVTSRQWIFNGGTPATSTASSQAVTFNTAGDYAIKLKVANAQGSDSITKTSYIHVQPAASPNGASLYEGFESITVPGSGWAVNNGSDAYTWTNANVGATGNKSVMIDNYHAASGDIDELVSPSVNLNPVAGGMLTFKVAYAQTTSGSADQLLVFVSKDCGKTWQQKYSKAGAALSTASGLVSTPYTPAAGDWRMETVIIQPAFISTNTMVKFMFISAAGNNIYLDDINLSSVESVEDFAGNIGALQVIPNPFTDAAAIKIMATKEETVHMELKDLLGHTVAIVPGDRLSAGDNTFTLRQDNLSKGLYLLDISSESGRITKKVIIQ